MIDPRIIGPIYLGWALGTNDSANVFGTAVSSFMVNYRIATILIGIFVILGSLIGGMPGLKTLGSITGQSINTAFFISISAALTVTIMTYIKIPVSTSQAVVGSILGVGILHKYIKLSPLIKVIICWITTPFGAIIISFSLYFFLSKFFRKLNLHFLTYDRVMRILLISSGIYGAFSLGANNVANITGVFYKAKVFNSFQALLIGGASIALGALTYSRNVMITVGRRIIPIDAFSAFIAVLSEAITVHIYAIIGVPVSTSQAIVGAVIGIGLLKGVRTVSKNTVIKIMIGWFLTPLVSMIFSLLFGILFKL